MQGQQTNKNNQASSPVGAMVFIVDDDATVRRSLTRLLRSASWNVESFSSARNSNRTTYSLP